MKKIAVLALLMVTSFSFAQKVKVEKGDFKALKGQTEVNVVFDYSKMQLMKENLTEAQYVENRAKELNEKNKGNGEVWKKKWEGAKDGIWNPKFLEIANTVSTKEKTGISFQEGLNSAKYTVIVEAVWVYPGWDVAMMKQPAKVTTRIKLVETANKGNVLGEVFSENAPGDQWGSNFSNESRIGEGFAKTAKTFVAKFVAKDVK
ncbi:MULTISPECIES: hypothetical protein [Flavobacterium]|uniref:DUF4468 domain-containing protein n=1 Tax=Flavobacterium hankyongi TaxID=1176532 RepID=A0ABP9A7V0_9FLAO|nr:hypothetical protein [Flavobacterium sp. N1846]